MFIIQDINKQCGAVNKAFQFTSITSVTILDCWAIVWSIILTWMFLATRYSLWQFLGAAICVGGLALVLLSDAGVADGGSGSNPLLGDFLVIAGSIFFTLSTVGEVSIYKLFKTSSSNTIYHVLLVFCWNLVLFLLFIEVGVLREKEESHWSSNDDRCVWYAYKRNRDVSLVWLLMSFCSYRCCFLKPCFSTVLERNTLASMKWSVGLVCSNIVHIYVVL